MSCSTSSGGVHRAAAAGRDDAGGQFVDEYKWVGRNMMVADETFSALGPHVQLDSDTLRPGDGI